MAVVTALPTMATDIGRIAGLGPAPDRVYYVSPDDVAAYSWMKRHLPAAALVQELSGTMSGVVALGERRTTLGDWVHAANYQVGEERVRERHRQVYGMLFMGRDARSALAIANELGIEYVYIGREAREKLEPAALAKFDRCEGYFENVYSRNDGVVLYRVRGKGTAVAEAKCS